MKKRRSRSRRRSSRDANLEFSPTGSAEDSPTERRRRRRRNRARWRWSKRRLAAVAGIAGLGMAAVGILAALVVFVPRLGAQSYENALQHFERSDYPATIITLKGVLSRSPDDLSSRLLIGRAYLKVGYARAAEQELRRAQLSGADRSLTTVPLGTALLQQGKHDDLFAELPLTVREPALRAEIHLLHGKAHLALRGLPKAQSNFRAAEKLLRDDARPPVGRAQVMLHRGRFAQARALIDQITTASPKHADAWYVKSELHRAERDFEAALDSYDQVLAIDDRHITARLGRAATLIDLDQDMKALDDLRVVWSIRPDDPQAYYLYALVLSKMNEIDKAQAMLERASMGLMRSRTEFVMRHPPSLLLMGVIYFKNGRYDDAQSLLERYIHLEPNHPGARKLLANILLKRELPSVAIDVLKPTVGKRRADPEALALLSQAHMRLGQAREANELLELAAEIAPNQADIRTQLAMSRLVIGRRDEAIQELESAMSLGTGSERAGTMLALLQLRSGQLEAALATAKTLIDRESAGAAAHNLSGTALLAMGRIEEARSAFHKALEVDGQFVTALHNLAKIDLHDDNPEQAAKPFEEALNRVPDDVSSMVELAKLARRKSDLEGAINWLEKARAIDAKALSPQLDLIELYLLTGRMDQAKRLTDSLEDKFPDNLAVLVAKGRVELATGNERKATDTFRQLSETNEDSVERLFKIAKYQVATNDVIGARESLDKILAQSPGHLPSHAALAELDIRQGNNDSALARARQIQLLEPDLGLGYLLAGDVLMREEKFRLAGDEYARGFDKQPSTEMAVRQFRARRAAGKLGEAIEGLEGWVATHPDESDARRALAAGYIDSGQWEEALGAHESLLADLPDDAALLNNLAGLYLRTSNPQALEFAERAYRLAPKQSATLDTLGWVLVHEGKPAKALRYLREAHDRSATDLRVRYHIAAALDRLGRHQEARRELKRALRPGKQFEGHADAQALLEKLGG